MFPSMYGPPDPGFQGREDFKDYGVLCRIEQCLLLRRNDDAGSSLFPQHGKVQTIYGKKFNETVRFRSIFITTREENKVIALAAKQASFP
jgi:hypothetical protein